METSNDKESSIRDLSALSAEINLSIASCRSIVRRIVTFKIY
jgi:hypothetical protein